MTFKFDEKCCICEEIFISEWSFKDGKLSKDSSSLAFKDFWSDTVEVIHICKDCTIKYKTQIKEHDKNMIFSTRCIIGVL